MVEVGAEVAVVPFVAGSSRTLNVAGSDPHALTANKPTAARMATRARLFTIPPTGPPRRP
jgi:hypothetical protein